MTTDWGDLECLRWTPCLGAPFSALPSDTGTSVIPQFSGEHGKLPEWPANCLRPLTEAETLNQQCRFHIPFDLLGTSVRRVIGDLCWSKVGQQKVGSGHEHLFD